MSNPEDDIDWDQLAEAGFKPEDVVTPNQMRRRILWDIVPCDSAGDVMRVLGVSPGSDEVEDLEHKESHARVANIGMVLGYITEMSSHAADTLVASFTAAGMPVSEEEAELSRQRMAPMIDASARAIVAELVDLGILHTPHFVYSTEDIPS